MKRRGASLVRAFVWAILIVATIGLALILAKSTTGILVAVGILAVAGIAQIILNQRSRRAFVERYGSLDSLRGMLDHERFRTIRNNDGDVAAVRTLRRDYPGLTLTQSVEIVKSL